MRWTQRLLTLRQPIANMRLWERHKLARMLNFVAARHSLNKLNRLLVGTGRSHGAEENEGGRLNDPACLSLLLFTAYSFRVWLRYLAAPWTRTEATAFCLIDVHMMKGNLASHERCVLVPMY
jgi:hypothetical protein